MSVSETELRRRLAQGETYGMILEGFQSLPGIPDDFCSAEDPEVRARLWQVRRAPKPMPEDFCHDEDPDVRGKLWQQRQHGYSE